MKISQSTVVAITEPSISNFTRAITLYHDTRLLTYIPLNRQLELL